MNETLDVPTWSKSQAAVLTECRRKFYFSYRSADLENTPEVLEKAKALKELKNRTLWAASIVHEEVANVLKDLRQGQALRTDEEIISAVQQRMRDEFKKSKGEEGVQLFEHAYNVGVPNAAWQQNWSAVETAIRGFLGSKWLVRLKTLGPENWKVVDEVLSFETEGIKAYVKMDCAIEIEGRFILIDWKTSAPRPSDAAGIHLAALYAYEVWGAEPDQIEGFVVSLSTGQQIKVPVVEENLMDAQLRVHEGAEQLQAERSEWEGVADPFKLPMAQSIQTCARCNYQKFCFPKGINA